MAVEHSADQAESTGLAYCTVHPTVETNLRCNRCGRPMCSKCAVRMPVGYRCKECVRLQQDKFFNAQMLDYIVAAALSVVLSLIAAAILSRMGFFIVLLAGPAIGGLIGRAIFALTRKRRGRYIPIVVGAGIVLGALPFVLFNPLSVGLYIVLATGVAAGQFGLRLSA